MMELNIIIVMLTTVVSFISIAVAIYTRYLYKGKKSKEISLVKQIKEYNDDLKLLDNFLSKKIDILESIEFKLNITKSQFNINTTNLESVTIELKEKQSKLQNLILLENKGDTLNKDIDKHKYKIQNITLEIKVKNNLKNKLNKEINIIKEDIKLFSTIYDLVNLGFFEEPKYLFETSERFKEEILIIREEQKQLIQNKEAIIIPDTITIINDVSLAKKALQGQSKIMLKAFNIEVDLLLSYLKPNNLAKTLERIEKLATDIEKSAISLKCGFSQEYIKLKFKECELQYQFKLKQEDEREEQKAIKEQMREEQQSVREFERALIKVKKDEEIYKNALEEVRKEIEFSNKEEKDNLNTKISMLQMKLRETKENEVRAKSMAEQTKRGHVYIISNIGSFGENIYKIGMTRRLEPLDRIKELGNASVPFLFDVHAMIFSENAPALEKKLHNIFRERRVNKVNSRKEFFNLTLSEIEETINLHYGKVEFTKLAEAKAYRETLNM